MRGRGGARSSTGARLGVFHASRRARPLRYQRRLRDEGAYCRVARRAHDDTQYERAIEKGDDGNAMNNFGLLVEEGAEGVERNLDRALELYEQAIEKGDDGNAMHNLAVLMMDGGDEVVQNVTKAAKLFQRAIEEHDDVGLRVGPYWLL